MQLKKEECDREVKYSIYSINSKPGKAVILSSRVKILEEDDISVH